MVRAKSLTEKQIKRIKKLATEGKTAMEISFLTKISFWTIKYHIDENYRNQIKKSGSEYYKRKCQKTL